MAVLGDEDGTALLPCHAMPMARQGTQAMGDKIIYFPAALSSTATLL
jgi:hypothetical protein